MKLALSVAALAVVLSVRSCGTAKAPDQRLAQHLGALCEIATGGAAKPVAGVKKLGRYMAAHGGEMLGDFGDMIATIERIPDDDAHDERARLAHERLAPVLHGCANEWEEFIEAVDEDSEATELMNRAMRRLNRTLEIVLGGEVTLRDLPARFDALLPSSGGPERHGGR